MWQFQDNFTYCLSVLIVIFGVIAGIVYLILTIIRNIQKIKKIVKKSKPVQNALPVCTSQENTATVKDEITYNYKPKWLLTYNEKNTYYKLKAITNKYGLTLFTKVRLLDIIEPIQGAQDKAAFYKIQAKHVDFVICNEKLVAKWIVELQDSTHRDPKREERDKFVYSILTKCGYKVLQTYGINESEVESFLGIQPNKIKN